jgi:hypothetical protein
MSCLIQVMRFIAPKPEQQMYKRETLPRFLKALFEHLGAGLASAVPQVWWRVVLPSIVRAPAYQSCFTISSWFLRAVV